MQENYPSLEFFRDTMGRLKFKQALEHRIEFQKSTS